MIKPNTLIMVQQGNRILLGMKKRDFGMGRWNGFGGKLCPGETIEAAAHREIKEEAGIEVTNLEQVGRIDFNFKGKEGTIQVNIFRSTEFSGEPAESEEMRPQWFDVDQIPYGEMWPDDIYWLPLFLAGKKFTGRFLFGEGEGNTILEQELQEVSEIK